MSYKSLSLIIVSLLWSTSTLTRACFSQDNWTLEKIITGVLKNEKSIEDAKIALSVDRYFPADGTEDIRAQQEIDDYQKRWDKASPTWRSRMPTPEIFALSERRHAKWAKENGRTTADYEITFKSENMFIQHEYKNVTRIGGPPINTHVIRASDGKLYWEYSESPNTGVIGLYEFNPKKHNRYLTGYSESRKWKGRLSGLLRDKEVKLSGTDEFGDRQCPVLEITLEKGFLKVVVDPELGFSCVKSWYESSGQLKSQTLRRLYREWAPHIWRPTETEYSTYGYRLDGQRILKYRSKVTIKKAQINTDVADMIFAFNLFDLPPRAVIEDYRHDPPLHCPVFRKALDEIAELYEKGMEAYLKDDHIGSLEKLQPCLSKCENFKTRWPNDGHVAIVAATAIEIKEILDEIKGVHRKEK